MQNSCTRDQCCELASARNSCAFFLGSEGSVPAVSSVADPLIQPPETTRSAMPSLQMAFSHGALLQTAVPLLGNCFSLQVVIQDALQQELELQHLLSQIVHFPRTPVNFATPPPCLKPTALYCHSPYSSHGLSPLSNDNTSCSNPSPKQRLRRSVDSPPTVFSRRQRRRCNSGLIPQLKETPVPNPVVEAARETDNNEEPDFKVIRSEKAKQPKEHSRFATTNQFSVLAPTVTVQRAIPPARTFGKVATKPNARAVLSPLPRLGIRKHRWHKRKRSAFCRAVPSQPHRIRQTKLAPPPTKVWKISYTGMPQATATPLSVHCSSSSTCSLPEPFALTEIIESNSGETTDEGSSPPTLQSSCSSQAICVAICIYKPCACTARICCLGT